MKRVYVLGIISCLFLMAACSKEDSSLLRKQQYELKAVNNSGVSGMVYLSENLDSSFNITVVLNSSVKDTVHVMNVYNGTVTTQDNIAFKLVDIKGTGGSAIGETKNIGQFIASTGAYKELNYDAILDYSAVVKVLYSKSKDSVISIGKIGKF